MSLEDEIRARVGRYTDYPDEENTLVESVLRRLDWRRRHGFKVCSSCQERKSPAAFGADTRERDGLHYTCRECRRVNA